MGLITVLSGCLRMLLCTLGVFLALGMITLTMVVSRGTMCFRGVFMVFGSLVVLVSGHGILLVVSSQSGRTRDAGQRSKQSTIPG